MKRMTLAATRGFEKHSRTTRKAEFLARMESLMPWAGFCAVIEPHYWNPFLCSKVGNGRPPVGPERMLRMYCGTNWFNLADEACEDLNPFLDGMRLHIGADSQTGLVHSASVTAANVYDSHGVSNLLHGEGTRFYGDSAYRGK